MEKRLNEILERLVARRDAGDLTDDDFAYLGRLVAPRTVPAEGDPRPLWHWVRERAAAWDFSYFEMGSALELDESADTILEDAGAQGAPFQSSASRWTARVTQEGLRRALRRHLSTDLADDDGARNVAALFVGLAGFHDLAPLLVSALAGCREGRRSWWDDGITNALRSLAILDHPAMKELAPLYARHDTQSFRTPVRVWAALHAHELGAEALYAVFKPHATGEWCSYADALGCYHEAALKACEAGDLQEALTSALGENNPMWRAAIGLGRLAVEGKWKDAFKAWIAHCSVEMRGGAALAACWSKAKWARAAVTERLEGKEEQDPGVLACLTTAAITLDGDPDARLQEFLEHEDESRRLGAVWACLGRPGGLAKARTRLKDDAERVRDAAACVVVAEGHRDATEAMELVTPPLTRKDARWDRWLAHRALEVAGVVLPPAMLDHLYGTALRGSDEFARAKEFYAKHPHHLTRWAGDDYLGTLQGLLTPETARFSLEADLEAATDHAEATRIWLELSCAGGPRTPSGRLRGALLSSSDARRVTLEEDTLLPAVVIALSDADPSRVKALKALSAVASRVEPVLARVLNAVEDDSVVAEAVAGVLELDHANDPLLTEVKTLLGSPEVPVLELQSIAWIDHRLDGQSRLRLVERVAHPSTPDELAIPLLTILVNDTNSDVSTTAFSALQARVGATPWMLALLDLRSRYSDWNLRRQAAELLGRIGDERAVPRVLELLTDDDGDVQNHAVDALVALGARHASLGLNVLDIRDPERVRVRYGLGVEVDWSRDAREEGLRLLLLGLDGKKDASLAKKYKGRKLVVSRVKAEGEEGPQSSLAHPLSASEFEALALYLRVDFADDETGSIVADVTRDATGEVLSALLQSDSLVVASAAWS